MPARRPSSTFVLGALVAGLALPLTLLPGCGRAGATADDPPARPPVVGVETVRVTRQAITRTLRVTGTLVAQDQAQVSAETAGRVVETPVERGTPVPKGAVLVRLSSVQASAQLAESQANAATFEASLGLREGDSLDVERVPDVATARAQLQLAEADFARIRSLLDQNVVSQAEFDGLRTRVEAARQKYDAERNAAQQKYRSWEAARARVALAEKAVADTTVRAPFDGVVVERTVAVGDFVTTGRVVATLVKIDPLRLQLTIPEQSVAAVGVGQPVSFQVDAYPGRTFSGTVRFVSPALRADQRALTVEAIAPNPARELKPGFFATAEIARRDTTPAVVVPEAALRSVNGVHRVFAVTGDHLEERLVTVGQTSGALVEIVSGLREGDIVALPGRDALVDGMRVRGATPAPAAR